MRMSFGKYKGCDLEDIPDEYLRWLSGRDLYGRLAAAVEEELQYRADQEQERASLNPKTATVSIAVRPTDVSLAREVFDLGFRAAAFKRHPDRGGSTTAMQDLNLFAERIRGQLAQLGGGR